ncbi:MAG TPA: hypothetical protein VLW83_18080, partial [Candidatus Acidoferrales bacterium]|nr:hypothetical protein [Candidatus Acidoferrales bacterium]
MLFVAFERAEEKGAIPMNGASKSHAVLFSLEEWIWIRRISSQSRVSRKVVVAKEDERRTVELIGAGTGGDV